MDPLTTLGVAANVIQLVQFAGKLISESQEAYDSLDGTSHRNTHLEAMALNLQTLLAQLSKEPTEPASILPSRAESSARTSAEENLKQLVTDSKEIAKQLLMTLQNLKVQVGNRRWRSVKQALTSAWKQKDIAELQTRLSDIRQQIDTTLLICLR